ncbi:MAG: uroporphyrinogen decarboxylase, partial [Alphaproteobacteria bacterium]|nr:uroporphyrinogen decarboxylase [Alphaproteobacteria bacterium]
MTGYAPLLVRALRGEKTLRAPFWFMRQAGRYLPEYRALRAEVPDFIAFCLDPVRAAEVTLQPLRRFGMDAAILFADILLVPHALGLEVTFKESVGPRLSVVRDSEAVASLERNLAVSADRLAAVYDTVARVRAALPEGAALIGFAGSPWTVATYMVEGGGGHDFVEVRRLARRDPALFGALIDVIVRATIAYLDRQIAAGADAIQLFDTWASVLAADEFERWCLLPTHRIVTALRARHAGLPIIGFSRGAGTNLLRYAGETGIDAIGLDAGVAPRWAAVALPPRLCLQGNLDPILLSVGGEAMLGAARAILDAWSDR